MEMEMSDARDVECHQVILHVDPTWLFGLLRHFRGEESVCVPEFPDLPEGFTVYAVVWNPWKACWSVFVEHPSFPAVPPGEMPMTIESRRRAVPLAIHQG